jgi:hypothetical protein
VPFGPYSSRVDAAGYQALLAFDGRFPVLTLTEALEGGPERVAGRGVLVGLNALSVRDSFTTPLTTGLTHRQQPRSPRARLHHRGAAPETARARSPPRWPGTSTPGSS